MSIHRQLLIIGTALTLLGCESAEERRLRNEKYLPDGCKIIDLDYGDLRAAVVCDGRKTTTSVRSWDETTTVMVSTDGKNQYPQLQTNHYARIIAVIGH